jgi:hypothetical protein
MSILEILILCFLCVVAPVLIGCCIRTSSEDQPEFDPNGKARFVNGKWRVK